MGRRVHRVHAILDDHNRIVAHVRRANGRQHAAVRVYACDQERVDAVRAKRGVQVRALEAVVALLRLDNEIRRMLESRHDGAAPRSGEIMTKHVLSRRIRILGPGAPERIGADLLDVPVCGDAMDDGDREGASRIEQAAVVLDQQRRDLRRRRHGRNDRIEVPAMKVDCHDSGPRALNPDLQGREAFWPVVEDAPANASSPHWLCNTSTSLAAAAPARKSGAQS